MDEVTLSRMDTEWLVAWFYGRSQQVPPHVQERLKVVGFIDGDNLTDAGRRWLQTSRTHTVSKDGRGGQEDPAAGAQAFVEFETRSA